MRTIVGAVIGLSPVVVAFCGGDGVTRDEYDAIAAERDPGSSVPTNPMPASRV